MAVYPLLALLWAFVLVPPMVRRRLRNRAEFPEFDRARLGAVRTTPVAPQRRDEAPVAPVRRSATHRRRRILALIGVGIGATLVVALVLQTRLAWGMHLLAYDVLIAYVGLLARSRDKQPLRRRAVAPVARVRPASAVRRIPRAAPAPTPGAALPALLRAASR